VQRSSWAPTLPGRPGVVKHPMAVEASMAPMRSPNRAARHRLGGLGTPGTCWLPSLGRTWQVPERAGCHRLGGLGRSRNVLAAIAWADLAPPERAGCHRLGGLGRSRNVLAAIAWADLAGPETCWLPSLGRTWHPRNVLAAIAWADLAPPERAGCHRFRGPSGAEAASTGCAAGGAGGAPLAGRQAPLTAATAGTARAGVGAAPVLAGRARAEGTWAPLAVAPAGLLRAWVAVGRAGLSRCTDPFAGARAPGAAGRAGLGAAVAAGAGLPGGADATTPFAGAPGTRRGATLHATASAGPCLSRGALTLRGAGAPVAGFEAALETAATAGTEHPRETPVAPATVGHVAWQNDWAVGAALGAPIFGRGGLGVGIVGVGGNGVGSAGVGTVGVEVVGVGGHGVGSAAVEVVGVGGHGVEVAVVARGGGVWGRGPVGFTHGTRCNEHEEGGQCNTRHGRGDTLGDRSSTDRGDTPLRALEPERWTTKLRSIAMRWRRRPPRAGRGRRHGPWTIGCCGPVGASTRSTGPC
jgi:hypothetical protein